MNEHKVRYRTNGNPTNGCIHSMAKYAITIVRRDICPDLVLRSSKKSYKNGILQRRRNVTSTYDETINVIRNDPVDNTGPACQVASSHVNIVPPSAEKESSTNQVLTPVTVGTRPDAIKKNY